MSSAASPPVLDAEHAAFIQGPVSISVASRDVRNVPSVSRAAGCRVSPDGRRVTLILPASRSMALLTDLMQSGRLAAVFTRPSTHRSIQLKGGDARLVQIGDDELRAAAAYADSIVAELTTIGYDEPLIRAVYQCEAGDAIAVAFTPDAAFAQTPGPRAGQPLRAASREPSA